MTYLLRGVWLAALLGGVGCSAPAVGDYDVGVADSRGEICFPSCRLGEICTAANRCEAMTNPFRDAGAALDRGRD